LAQLDHVHVRFPERVGSRQRQIPGLEAELGRRQRAFGATGVNKCCVSRILADGVSRNPVSSEARDPGFAAPVEQIGW